jgi:hypothetical protein
MHKTLKDAELLAARMVDEHWPAIVRVAEALFERGELSGLEASRSPRMPTAGCSTPPSYSASPSRR